MDKKKRRGRDLSITKERKKWLLFHYFEAIKAEGEKAKFLPKSYLYEIAGEKVFLAPRTAGRYISMMLKDSKTVEEVKRMGCECE